MNQDTERLAQAKYHRDARVIAARKAYRTDVKAGVPERDAWARASAVFTEVQRALGLLVAGA